MRRRRSLLVCVEVKTEWMLNEFDVTFDLTPLFCSQAIHPLSLTKILGARLLRAGSDMLHKARLDGFSPEGS